MHIDSPLRIEDTQTFSGLTSSNITVARCGHLTLTGMCGADLVVYGTAIIAGMVARNVIIEGGTVELRGMVSGTVYNNAGNFQMAPTAMVRGQVVQQTTHS